jgi:hypothetical protein
MFGTAGAATTGTAGAICLDADAVAALLTLCSVAVVRPSHAAITTPPSNTATATGNPSEYLFGRSRNVVSTRSRDACFFAPGGVLTLAFTTTDASPAGVSSATGALRGPAAKLADISPSVEAISSGFGVTDGFSPFRIARTLGSLTGGANGARGAPSGAGMALPGSPTFAGLEGSVRSSSRFIGHQAAGTVQRGAFHGY